MSFGMWITLGIAGGCGAVLRFLIASWIDQRPLLGTTVGTMTVNVTACLLMGLLVGWGLGHPGGAQLTLIVGTGFLGDYSTFSTASVEAAHLFLDRRPMTGICHAAIMLIASLAAAFLGIIVMS